MEYNMASGAPIAKRRKLNVTGSVELNLCANKTAPEEEQLQHQLYQMKSLFGEMLNSPFTDVKIVCRGVEISAHKSVLFGRIPYFRDALNFDASGKDTLEVPPEISPDIVKLIVKNAYFYEPTITLQNAQALLEAAAFFRIEDLWEFCDEFIAKRITLTVEDCLPVQSYSVARSAKLLKMKADQFIAEHLTDVIDTDALKYLSDEEIVWFLGIKDADVLPNEEKFWEALVTWIAADPEKRKSVMPKLLGLLRLPQLSREVINGKVLQHSYVDNDPKCREMVSDVLLYKADPDNVEIKQKCEAAFCMKQRCKRIDHVYYFDVYKAHDGIHNRIYVLKSPDGEWVEKTWKGFPEQPEKVVAVKYIVYLVSKVGVLLAYNTVTDAWTVIQGDNGRPDLLKMELCSVNGKLVACGRPSRDINHVLVWWYDSSSNSWQQIRLRWPRRFDRVVKACCGANSIDGGGGQNLCVACYHNIGLRVLLFDMETGNLIKRGKDMGGWVDETLEINVVSYDNGKVFVGSDDWVRQYDVTLGVWRPLRASDRVTNILDVCDASDDLGAVAIANHRLYIIRTIAEELKWFSSSVEYMDLTDSSFALQDGQAVLKEKFGYDRYYNFHAVVCQYP